MFCSKCGRTLALEDAQCPHCGNPVGESRFEGTPYTSAQGHILPNAPVKQATAAFTRTTYTTMTEEQQQEGSVDSRTTYRPVHNGASVPEDVRKDMRAAIAGSSILIISHQERILNIADEVVVLRDGQVAAQGPKDQILPGLIGTSSAVPECRVNTEAGGAKNAEA